MVNPITALVACLRRLIARSEGNTAMIFGVCAIPVVIAAGMAVDVTRAYMVKMRLSSALDAASLAVGSEPTSVTEAQLETDLQKYFFANYPPTALGRNVTVAPIGQGEQKNLSQNVVTYQAQATLDMTFMQLIGYPSITVTATAQTTRDIGIEIALVLDNTGSMLCGDQDLSNCGNGVDPNDINCTDAPASNTSRICTLRRAAADFVNILTSAVTAPGQLYIGVVPYVTQVNVGPVLCSGPFTCSGISNGTTSTTDLACGPNFLDQYGFLVDIPFSVVGTTTNNGSTITINTSPTVGAGSQISTANLAVGMVVQQISSSSPWLQVTSGNVIPSTATITGITDSTHFTISPAATGAASNVLMQFGFTGTVNNTGTVTNVPAAVTTKLASNSTLLHSPPLANAWTVSGTGIPGGAGSRNNPERATSIQSVTAGTNSVTLCQPATNSSVGVSETIMLFNPVGYDASANPTYVPPTASASTNPGTSGWMGCIVEPTSSDENVSGAGALASATVDPDVNEPGGGWTDGWYAFWWLPGDSNNGGINNWAGNGIIPQTNLNPSGEVQGQEISDWDHFSGPNQGCPVPVLPLTDVTSSNPNGPTTVLNTVKAMWPRDAGGTQVHIGMIWGWRMLSANGPFPQNNGHPMTYANERSQAWKKVVILMTDGQEEWPNQNQLTGLGYVQDGKINTTNSNTAVTNLGTRLSTVCSNMAATGNFVIYTVGLAQTGQNNTQLQNCATTFNGGKFYAADTSNLDAAFQQIANSILALRLTQ